MLLFFLLIIVILFIPIPIKFRFEYKDKKIHLKIFKKELDLTNKNKAKKNKKSKKKNKLSKSKLDTKKFIKKIKSSKFKPILKTNINITYGLSNCALTAILEGFIYSFYPFFNIILSYFFKIKKINFKVNPVFNNKLIHIKINSIIFINLAKIIYIGILIVSNLHSIKNMPINKKNLTLGGKNYGKSSN